MERHGGCIRAPRGNAQGVPQGNRDRPPASAPASIYSQIQAHGRRARGLPLSIWESQPPEAADPGGAAVSGGSPLPAGAGSTPLF